MKEYPTYFRGLCDFTLHEDADFEFNGSDLHVECIIIFAPDKLNSIIHSED